MELLLLERHPHLPSLPIADPTLAGTHWHMGGEQHGRLLLPKHPPLPSLQASSGVGPRQQGEQRERERSPVALLVSSSPPCLWPNWPSLDFYVRNLSPLSWWLVANSSHAHSPAPPRNLISVASVSRACRPNWNPSFM